MAATKTSTALPKHRRGEAAFFSVIHPRKADSIARGVLRIADFTRDFAAKLGAGQQLRTVIIG
jgi:hypothetical protein